jgi:hypothetical protein
MIYDLSAVAAVWRDKSAVALLWRDKSAVAALWRDKRPGCGKSYGLIRVVPA